MSALGHQQTYAPQTAMSALALKADVCGANPYVCFGPKADMPTSIRSPRQRVKAAWVARGELFALAVFR
jgi:hypothetical protein